MTNTARTAAARAIAATLSGASLSKILPTQLDTVAARERALVQQLSYGTLRSYHRLQGILEQLLKKPLKSKDDDIHALLLCGLYQLLEMRVPDHAALSATVESCRELGKNWATGLVNGVLRRSVRERESLLENLSPAQQASLPQWLFEQIRKAWPQQLATIIAAANSHPPMCLRVNQQQVSTTDYKLQLHAAGINSSVCALTETGLRLETAVDVALLPGFAQGHASVQDEGAQLAATLLKPQPGERVLDACSAPGGKACHLLEQQPQLTELVAADNSPERLHRVAENLQRLALSATLLVEDASNPSVALEDASFQSILIDAPCSGSGVLRRHPDIKLLRRPTDIKPLAELQLQILTALWPKLAAGGNLLYVTCSILPAENQQVVARFLQEQSDAEHQPLQTAWGVECEFGRQLLPQAEGADGLYYALLRKAGSSH
ncbi:16S rRNA (cytosine(967)-C(5))-methyltransferase RsmB [Halieaceae bacterium IMCC14734]|uniref:16S rRNA (cytosine(967)-C(5))-methyltransferase n=1 Tax=Candidatus Litorirhabdus singularis TaxID=2518993 RepID=A0ABT3TEV7_9GAMM|nr:16S rRNA (cytosine(967)-C(5))-methyltransferase RsmB [Candidatus Litorirhabdus singularis]MCX2979952.1 16S rRNA (cytosine(967)-C(5))-methyltransferase RsmB [Candidatus Litorirhabdus singularis]